MVKIDASVMRSVAAGNMAVDSAIHVFVGDHEVSPADIDAIRNAWPIDGASFSGARACGPSVLKAILAIPSLKVLHVRALGEEFNTVLEQLSKASSLEVLTTDNCWGMTEKGYSELTKLFNLNYLYLEEYNMGADDFAQLASIPSLARIRLIGAGFEDLWPLFGSRSIQEIWLNGRGRISDSEVLKSRVEALKLEGVELFPDEVDMHCAKPRLEHLQVWAPTLFAGGRLRHVAKNLRVVLIQCVGTALHDVLTALQAAPIRALSMSKIDPSVAGTLSSVTELHSMEALALSCDYLDALPLDVLSRMPTLRVLRLNGTAGRTTIRNIREIVDRSSIRILDLMHVKSSEELIELPGHSMTTLVRHPNATWSLSDVEAALHVARWRPTHAATLRQFRYYPWESTV